MPPVLKPGDKVRGYVMEELLHRGMMALSYRARNGKDTVFFKLYKSPTVRVPWYTGYKSYQQELKKRIETTMCKNFCYRFIDSFEDKRCLFQVYEFLDRSLSLEQVLEKCAKSPAAVKARPRLIMAKVLMSGINALHKFGKITHSDLKPANIMLIEDKEIEAGYRLRIIDMDFSILSDRTAPWDGHQGYYGTPGYMSPEHARGEKPQPASDVFTCGLMLYELLAQGHPYRFESEEQYRAACVKHKAERPRLQGDLAALPHAEDIVHVLHACLSPKAADRPTALEVNEILNRDKLPASGRTPRPPELKKPPVPPPAPRKAPVPERDTPPAPEVRTPDAPTPPPEPKKKKKSVPAELPAGKRLVLRGPDGTEQSFGITTPLGRIICRQFGEDSQFMADLQFTLELTDEGWFVVPATGTGNETMLNGKRVGERTRLSSGDILGVGREAKGIFKLPMTVVLP